MVGFRVTLRSVQMAILLVLFIIPIAHSFNLGLIAGDLKKQSSPRITKKIIKLSPIFINVDSGVSKLKAPLSLPKVPPKPPPWRVSDAKKVSKKVARSISTLPKMPLLPTLPVLPPILPKVHILPTLPVLPPILPKIPILPALPVLPPIFPSLIPILPKKPFLPILPKKPLLPLFSKKPLLPILPKNPFLPISSKIKLWSSLPKLPPLPTLPNLKCPLKPLSVPIIKRSPLEKFENELIELPSVRLGNEGSIQRKLLNLRKKTKSLTKEAFNNFKKLLLK